MKVRDSDLLAWLRGKRKTSQVLGAFGMLDFTMLRAVLAWRAFWNLRTVHFFNFPIFFCSGYGKPRYWISGYGGTTVYFHHFSIWNTPKNRRTVIASSICEFSAGYALQRIVCGSILEGICAWFCNNKATEAPIRHGSHVAACRLHYLPSADMLLICLFWNSTRVFYCSEGSLEMTAAADALKGRGGGK
jgi:hypothetical protein